MRYRVLSIVFALAAAVAAGSLLIGAGPQAPNQGQQKWEYKFIDVASQGEQDANTLGDQGWELAAVTANNENGGSVYHYYFKRPK